MIGIAVASILIGAFCALFFAFIHKNSNLRQHPNIEMSVFLLAAFVPYVKKKKKQ